MNFQAYIHKSWIDFGTGAIRMRINYISYLKDYIFRDIVHDDIFANGIIRFLVDARKAFVF